MLACVKNTSFRHRATVGYRRIRVWPRRSKKVRYSSRISPRARGRLNGEWPMNPYGTHGASWHRTWSPSVQNADPHDWQVRRWNPSRWKYARSYSAASIGEGAEAGRTKRPSMAPRTYEADARVRRRVEGGRSSARGGEVPDRSA